MILKIRLLAGVFLLMVMFSAIACADNLLIGGILQEAMNNPKYQEIAVSLNAEYIPTYYGGFKSDVTEVRKAALGIASVQNGLLGLDGQPNQALNHHYETIVAYSGGSSTAVTALADYSKYKLTCDTLILVSPMAAGVSDATIDKTVLGKKIVPHGATLGGMVGQIMDAANSGDTEANTKFEEQILTILKNNPNLKIIVIQSPQDKPTLKSETYQYSFTKDGNAFKEFENRITIHNQELDSRGLLDKGINAHNDLFFDFAKTHLANTGSRIEFSPTGQSSAYSTNSNFKQLSGTDPEIAKGYSGTNSLGFKSHTTPENKFNYYLPKVGNYPGYREPPSSSGSSGGLSPGQKQAIEQAIDNMVPGEYNQYYNTEPRFELAGNPRLD